MEHQAEHALAGVCAQLHWTFVEGFNPVMEITALDERHELTWPCVAGHDLWKDNTFRLFCTMGIGKPF